MHYERYGARRWTIPPGDHHAGDDGNRIDHWTLHIGLIEDMLYATCCIQHREIQAYLDTKHTCPRTANEADSKTNYREGVICLTSSPAWIGAKNDHTVASQKFSLIHEVVV